MQVPGDALRLTIYLGEAQHHAGRPTFEGLVKAAREAGLDGATVLRGPMSYGHSSALRTSSVLALSRDLPVIVTMIDTAEKIAAFLPTVDAMLESGLVTTEPVRVVRCGPRPVA
jgi:hypothetical protein